MLVSLYWTWPGNIRTRPGSESTGAISELLSTSCNRAFFIGIAVESLEANRRAWGQYMACESRPDSPKREKICGHA